MTNTQKKRINWASPTLIIEIDYILLTYLLLTYLFIEYVAV